MARLILLNGAPGTGKSTLAQLYLDSHPLALALDIDTVRAMLGRWIDRPVESGLAARAMAIEMARAHLFAGHDVIVAQYLGRVEFVDQLDRLSRAVCVPFIEIALLADAANAVARFSRRSQVAETSSHRNAAALQQLDGGFSAVADAIARVEQVIAQRPNTRLIHSVDGEIDLTYQRLLAQLDR
ncbi:MAG: ATP-binding protein [Actinomycetota bacterium]|nr:ATP-binding protein [Actinomycetota bacterium]